MRRRYVQDPVTFKLIEVTEAVEPLLAVDSGALWGDRYYDGIRSTDGVPIDTRSKHRAYMRERGLTTVDDYSQSWKDARVSRDDFFTGGGDKVARREAIERAIHDQNKGK